MWNTLLRFLCQVRNCPGFCRRSTPRPPGVGIGYAVSGHPLELFDDVAWDTYCPVARLGEHVGETVMTCGLVVEQRTHHQITGEPMKFLTLADWTGMVETRMLFCANLQKVTGWRQCVIQYWKWSQG